MPVRKFFVYTHRYLNLVLAVFLIIVSLTGSLLAFNTELERFFAPQLFASVKDSPKLDLASLAKKAENLVEQGVIVSVIHTEHDQVKAHYTDKIKPQGQPSNIGNLEVYLDPWTGEELGRRQRGDLSEGLINLMPFIYKLHWMLAINSFGQILLGIVALLWTIDCFIGFYLTLPTRQKNFFTKWLNYLRIKKNASYIRFNFDIHRAFGLWFWVFLFIFAWSSVMMNIRPVYETVMSTVFDYQSSIERFQAIKKHKNPNSKLTWQSALDIGQRLMAEKANEKNFTVIEPLGLSQAVGFYMYEVRSSHDVFEYSPKGGSTSILFDGDGTLVAFMQPTHEKTGNTVESWLYALHMARILGLPYKIFVAILGLVISVLTITGIIIWLEKRKASSNSP